MLNVCCLKWGSLYGPEYVNILHDMVSRNLPEGLKGRFICFTDDAEGINKGVEVRPLPHDLHGWWGKLSLFKEGVFPEGERVLFLDLDTIILGPLDSFASYNGEFACLKDFYRRAVLNSGLMAWRAGFGHHIWTSYVEAGFPDIEGGDQEWISRHVSKADLWQEILPGQVASYKLSVGFPDANIVCFHGIPKPHECTERWVKETWKIGGLSKSVLEQVCNTEKDRRVENILTNVKRDVQWFDFDNTVNDEHIAIVAGGPSLKYAVREIQYRKTLGQKIWAVNNTGKWLESIGIIPDAHVLIDARPDNIEFVSHPNKDTTYYLASQCHPSIFDAVTGHNVVMFHLLSDSAETALKKDEFKDKPVHLIGNGSTVGLKAIGLAYLKGCRNIHLYGFDSSYEDGKHHAYEQRLNDNERVLDVVCDEEKFRCAPWMIAQANEFQDIAKHLSEQGCTLTVNGTGLIPYIAQRMSYGGLNDLPDDHDMSHLRGALKHVKQFRMAVDAGAHRGIWTKEMSGKFDAVIAFEPQPDNFQRLTQAVGGNVWPLPFALGETEGKAAIESGNENSGQWHLKEGNDLTVVPLDNFELHALDFLKIDVEGYELKALKGARKNIERHSPVICIELNGLTERYGDKVEDINQYLSGLGYREVERFNKDHIFVRG